MNTAPQLSLRVPTARALLVLIAVLSVLFALAIHNSPAPRIEASFGGASVDIRADRAWALWPGSCVTINWDLARVNSVYVDGHSQVGSGEMTYCPSLKDTSLTFEIAAENGDKQTFSLIIRYLLSDLAKCLSLLAILFLLILALDYLVSERIWAPMRFERTHFLVFMALLIACLLCQTGSAFRIDALLDGLSRVFNSWSWQAFGLLLSGFIFIPLAARTFKRGLQIESREDFIAIGTFLLFMLFLYLPFGFDSVVHWEGWVFRAVLESDQPVVSNELVSRFWVIVPSLLANLIAPESFAGYHLVDALMFWGKMTLFYGILRKLNVDPLFAFLTSLLFISYPVNPSLMSIRDFIMNARLLSLFAAVFFCLDFLEHSGRLRLAGVWLALLLHVGSYEAGYVMIAVIPLLWWRHSPRRTWRNVKLTAIWYLFPIAKIAYLLLLSLDSRRFYGAERISSALEVEQFKLDSVIHYAGIIEDVYRQTFWYSWRDALTALSQSAWIVAAIAVLTLTGVVAAYLARGVNEHMFPSRRQISMGLLSGCLFVLPSIGVLMWIEKYSSDLRRMYIFVPIGAAIALFALILLIASLIKNFRLRKAAVICFCLLVMFPALARLFGQHALHVNRANNKAKILLQIVEQAPAIDPDAYVILATEMLGTELRDRGVSEFRTNAFHSALQVVYQDADLRYAFICIIDKRCFLDEYTSQEFHLHKDLDYSNVVLFRLRDDLSVELLRELPPELGGEVNDSYSPERLIDSSAPIPSRAFTMLSSARYTAINS